MRDINELGQNIAIPYEVVSGGMVTNNSWPTDQIFVIRMKDGSFALGANIRYRNEQGSECLETCRIFLDENDVPFVALDIVRDFTPKDCENEIISRRHADGGIVYVVKGMPLLTITDGKLNAEQSVFSFTEESKTLRYFCSFGNSASFNQFGLSLMVKFVEHPGSKEFINERTSVTTPAELEFLSGEMKVRFHKFLNGKINAEEMAELCKSFEDLRNRSHMDNNTIGCDMAEIEAFFQREAAGFEEVAEDVAMADEEVQDEMEEEEYEYETEADDDVE